MMSAARHWSDGRPVVAARRGWGFSTGLTWLAVIAAFSFSHLMLEALGVQYETEGGGAWQKIAPGTYFAVLAVVVLLLERGPWHLADDLVRRHKGLLILAFAFMIQFLQIVLIIGAPLSATFDTFIFPMCLLLMLTHQSEAVRRRMALFVHGFMAFNAVIAGFEFATQTRLTPMFILGIPVVDWRSSALLGHPLMNALATGCYALALMLGGGRTLPKALVAPALLLQLLAMVFFGGRAATALLVLFAGVIGAKHGAAVLMGRRFSLGAAAAMFIAVPVLVVGVGMAVSDGLLDRFIMRFVDDEGSANARLIMFDVLGQFTWAELLIGPNPDELGTLLRVHGIPFGIESFWFAFIAYYGILTSIPMFIGLFAFMADVRRHATANAWWVIAFFLIVASTSVSLSGKSTIMGVMVAIIVLTMRPKSTPPGRA